MSKAYLVLEDGTALEGTTFGADTESVGELVFTTGMCGYIETLTDPSYFGQIVLQTFPLIGNYGIIPEDFEGACAVRGYVVREWCGAPSNFRAQYDLDTFLRDRGIPGICGVDTRRLTRIIREKGVMNAAIVKTVPNDLSFVREYRVFGAVRGVTVSAPETFAACGEEKYRVTLIDYGAKRNIVRELQKRGCTVTVVGADTPAEEILAQKPDGIMLSNGPGDPAENTYEIGELQKLIGQTPIFGICLGHQLLALAPRRQNRSSLNTGIAEPISRCAAQTARVRISPARIMAMRSLRTVFPPAGSVLSMRTTAPAKGLSIRMSARLPCSFIRKPAAGRKTPDFCLTNSLR